MNFLVSFSFLSTIRSIGEAGTFLLFTGIGVLFLVFFFYYLPETKGRKLEDIEGLFYDIHWGREGRGSNCIEVLIGTSRQREKDAENEAAALMFAQEDDLEYKLRINQLERETVGRGGGHVIQQADIDSDGNVNWTTIDSNDYRGGNTFKDVHSDETDRGRGQGSEHRRGISNHGRLSGGGFNDSYLSRSTLSGHVQSCEHSIVGNPLLVASAIGIVSEDDENSDVVTKGSIVSI